MNIFFQNTMYHIKYIRIKIPKKTIRFEMILLKHVMFAYPEKKLNEKEKLEIILMNKLNKFIISELDVNSPF